MSMILRSGAFGSKGHLADLLSGPHYARTHVALA
jgi:hypothetical protein